MLLFINQFFGITHVDRTGVEPAADCLINYLAYQMPGPHGAEPSKGFFKIDLK